MFITSTEAKVQDGRQAQGQIRQRLVIQRWGKGTGRQAGSGSGRVVRQVGTRLGTRKTRVGKHQKPGRQEKRDWGKAGVDTKMLVGLTNKTNWQQTNREHRYKYSGLRKYSPPWHFSYFVALQPGIKIDFCGVCVI